MFDPTILHELGCVPGKIQWDEKAQKLPVLYRMARENRYKVVPQWAESRSVGEHKSHNYP